MTLDAKIKALNPGQQIVLGKSNGFTTLVERSCNGKTLRFVRESKSGFEVFKTQTW